MRRWYIWPSIKSYDLFYEMKMIFSPQPRIPSGTWDFFIISTDLQPPPPLPSIFFLTVPNWNFEYYDPPPFHRLDRVYSVPAF